MVSLAALSDLEFQGHGLSYGVSLKSVKKCQEVTRSAMKCQEASRDFFFVFFIVFIVYLHFIKFNYLFYSLSQQF